MKRLALLIAVVAFASMPCRAASDEKAPALSPVLVELFTSEGCSSCPPADEFVQRLDEDQPVPGAQLIVLSEHVDYFNHEGWRDPYSSSLFTERQYAYVHALRLNDAYTPQILVDGADELWDKTPQQMDSLLRQAAATPKVPVLIRSVTIDRQIPVLRAQIEVDGTLAKHNADIYAAVALDHAESQVLRGENKGQHLTHVAVVEVLKTVGKLKKGTTVDKDITIKLTPELASKHLRLVVFVQESGPGRVLGAATQKDID